MSMLMSGLGRRRQAPPQAFGNESSSLRDDVAAPRVKSKKDETEEGNYTLLSCLACAQHSRVDFTGFSWVNAQGTLGRGGQGVVAQTRASVDTVFAFKRRRPPTQGLLNARAAAAKDHAFREICSEIMALGHEDLRRHENIVQLIAISWEIENVKDWKSKSDVAIWPVMVLEKAELGDLGRFLRGKGVETDLETRLRMCAGIASALAVVHKNGIVHGDIKPDNALVFGGGVVKLSDFGFSALASNKLFDLAGTYPWRAPEIISLDGATHQQAKLTDLYSFGMLCLWVIFRNKLAEMGEESESPPLVRRSSSSLFDGLSSALSWLSTSRSTTVAPATSDLELLKLFNTPNQQTNKMPKLAHDLVEGLPKDKIRNYLGELFARLLSFTPSSRTSQDTAKDLGQISQGLLDISSKDETKPIKRIDAPQKDNRPTPGAFPRARDFQVSNSLESLCHADFRVRKHIFDCLLQEYNEAKEDDGTKAMVAVQLAFCKEVGFGATKHSPTADTYRRVGQIESIQLQSMIESTRTSQQPFNAKLRALCASGIIQPIHYGTDFRSVTDPDVLEEMQKSREEEIERMETTLGKTHPAILNLKWSLTTLLMDSQSRLGPIKYLQKMMQELDQDPKHGPLHRDSLITRGYFCVALNRLMDPSTAETIVAYSKETYSAVVDHGLADHVVSLQLSVQISDILENMGHMQESMRFLELAQLGTDKKFGAEHANTVLLLDKKTDRLMREGKLADALDNLKDISKRMEGLVDDEDNIKPYLRRKNAALFSMGSHFTEALALVEDDFVAMRARGIPEGHPAYLEGLMMKASMLVELGRFEEAAACARSVIRTLRGMPWPPPPPPQLHGDGGDPQNAARSAVEELAELLGKSKMVTPDKGAGDLEGPAPEGPSFNLDILPAHPGLLGAQIALVTALHARAHQLTTGEIMGDRPADAHEEAAQLNENADNDLDGLLRAVGEKLKGVSGFATARATASQSKVDREEATCRASSAILGTMDKGFVPLVELVAGLGMRNARGGLHYDKAVAAARRLKLGHIGDILAEHRLLCAGNEPGADAPAMFGSAADLVDGVTGRWTGTYLYENGGDRKEPTGRKTVTLRASPAATSTQAGRGEAGDGAGNEDWDVDVEGSSRDEMGDWVVKGRAWVSGEIVLRFFHEEGSEEQGWEYTGYLNPARRACGGYWGIRKSTRETSGGTFLFYNFG